MGLAWNGRPTGSQASAFCFWPPQTLPPTSSHTQTFQGWGEPQTPRTPRGGAPCIPGSGAPGMGTGGGLPLCRHQ